MSDAHNRWMPPSPHREQILEEIARGAAHIVERGHGLPPLLVFEDGGMIELPRVRYRDSRRGMVLAAEEGPVARGETHFYDVCGTVDEILGRVRESQYASREAQDSDRAYLTALLDDIGYMLERMTRRSARYRAFFEELHALAGAMLEDGVPESDSAETRVGALAEALVPQDEDTEMVPGDVVARAENVRALAQALEDHLARSKATAMQVAALFDEIKGGRNWPSDPAPGSEVQSSVPDAG
jgi:hypothetical protein